MVVDGIGWHLEGFSCGIPSGLPDLLAGHAAAECHVESQSALKAEFLSPREWDTEYHDGPW